MIRKYLNKVILPEENGIIIEAFLKKEYLLTKAQIRSLKFREDGIRLNGHKARINQALSAGDFLELKLWEEEKQESELLSGGDLPEILYEDEDLIALFKPSGLVVHPAHGHYQDSLSNQLIRYYRSIGDPGLARSIGRLDKDTSGIVVFAKHSIAAAKLWKQKEEGIFLKEYLAWCEGIFPKEAFLQEIRIDLPMRSFPSELNKMEVCMDVKHDNEVELKSESESDWISAVTWYQALKERQGHTLVRLHLETGRTHQIRAHLAAIGHPLLGDPIYGSGIPGRDHAMLHAGRCEFCQPFTGEKIVLIRESEEMKA